MTNEHQPKNFLEELQSLSEANKKRVLIIGTIVIMAIVIGVWATYFNSIIAQGGQQAPGAGQTASAVATMTPSAAAQGSTPAPVAPAGPGVWQNIEGAFARIESIFSRPSNYSIQPQ